MLATGINRKSAVFCLAAALFMLLLGAGSPVVQAGAVGQTGDVRVAGTHVPAPPESPLLTDEIEADAIPPAAGIDALGLHRQALQVDQLRAGTGSDGSGVTIAIIDTGVDPAADAISLTPRGQSKVTLWKDFTGRGSAHERAAQTEESRLAEGDVVITAAATANDGQILTRQGLLSVENVPSRSGVYRYGYFEPPRAMIPAGAGTVGDSFAVLVTDEAEAGIYDTVYIDVNEDGTFQPRERIRPFTEAGEIQIVSDPDGFGDGLAVVVTEITGDGHLVNLGFDANGHGTQVAGLAAGNLPGQLVGMAPGAEVMVLKALRHDGEGSWASIADALRFAIDEGADVINISVAGVAETAELLEEQSAFLQELLRGRDRLIVMAAGNTGPGLGTIRIPTAPGHLLTVGAFISTEIWESHYGFRVPQDRLWIHSAVGPRSDGELAPDLVAPGAAWSIMPSWAQGGTEFMEGTSVAAPLVSGSAALLVDAARRRGDEVDVTVVREVLQETARPLDDYLPVEQGYGVPQLMEAWQAMLGRDNLERTSHELSVRLGAQGAARGLYARDWLPGSLLVRIENQSDDPRSVSVNGLGGTNPGWWVPEAEEVRVSGLSNRLVRLNYSVGEAPGVYTDFVRFETGDHAPLDLLQTVVRPHALDHHQPRLNLSGELGPAERDRHFIDIPSGTRELTVTLQTAGGEAPDLEAENGDNGDNDEEVVTGRVRAFVVGPDGILRGELPWTGGPDDPEAVDETFLRPTSGTWEVVVYGYPGLSRYGLLTSAYELETAAAGVSLVLDDELRVDYDVIDPLHDEVRIPVRVWGYGKTVTGNLVGVGLVEETAPSQTQTLRLDRQRPIGSWEFSLPDEVIMSQIAVRRTVGQNPVPVQMDIYHIHPETGAWNRVRDVETSADGDRISLLNPETGDYVALVYASGTLRQVQVVELNHLFMRDSGEVAAIGGSELSLTHANTQVDLVVRVPPSPGRYVGYAAFEGEDGSILNMVPFFLQLGHSPYTITAFGGTVGPDGLGAVSLTVRDESGRPWVGTLEIDGHRYHTLEGFVSFEMEPEDDEYRFTVRVPVESMGHHREDIAVPIGEHIQTSGS